MPPIPVTFGVVSTGEVDLSVCFFWSSILFVVLVVESLLARSVTSEIIVNNLFILFYFLFVYVGTVVLSRLPLELTTQAKNSGSYCQFALSLTINFEPPTTGAVSRNCVGMIFSSLI